MGPMRDTHGFGPVPTRRLRGYGAEHPGGGGLFCIPIPESATPTQEHVDVRVVRNSGASLTRATGVSGAPASVTADRGQTGTGHSQLSVPALGLGKGHPAPTRRLPPGSGADARVWDPQCA